MVILYLNHMKFLNIFMFDREQCVRQYRFRTPDISCLLLYFGGNESTIQFGSKSNNHDKWRIQSVGGTPAI